MEKEIVLNENQIEAVVQWLEKWEQLYGTAIPLRFKEDFKNRLSLSLVNTKIPNDKEIEEALHKEIGHIFSEDSIVYTNILNRLKDLLSTPSLNESLNNSVGKGEAVDFLNWVAGKNYHQLNGTVLFRQAESQDPLENLTAEQLYQEFKSKQ